MKKEVLLTGLAILGASYICMSACEKKAAPAAPPPKSPTGAAANDADHDDAAGDDHDHDHEHDADHDHDHDAHDDHDHHGGEVVDLGGATIAGFDVKVTRDAGTIAAGGEAAIDVTVTAAASTTAKVAAVRFWIGTEDAAGSIKAKGEIEDADEPNRWHAHAEVPDPIPAAAKLWIEIETDGGAKHVMSVDLKA